METVRLKFVKYYGCLFVSVVLITGGSDSPIIGKSGEIYNSRTNKVCSLPQLPEARDYHTQDGDLACGGFIYEAYTTCVKWSPVSGTWNKSHTLEDKRLGHVSWATASGVYLIGGTINPTTTQKMKKDGSVEKGFDLKYKTR